MWWEEKAHHSPLPGGYGAKSLMDAAILNAVILMLDIFIKVYLDSELYMLNFSKHCSGMEKTFHEHVTEGRAFHKGERF